MRTAAICPTCATYENALCVIYDGPGLTHIDVAPLDNVSDALEKIDTAIGALQAGSSGSGGTSGTSGTSGTNGSAGQSGSSGTSGTSATGSISGTPNYLAKFTGPNTLGNSLVYDDGATVQVDGVTVSRGGSNIPTNVAIGDGTLQNNGVFGASNTAVGNLALNLNDSGYSNTAVGRRALYSNLSGISNTGIGSDALYSNSGGYLNVAVGSSSLSNNIDGFENISIGVSSLSANTSGNRNSAIGHQSLYFNTTGFRNCALGFNAGSFTSSSSANETSNNSVYLGYSAKASASGNANEIVIGSETIGNGSNSVTLGNASITKTILRGDVGVNITTPSYTLHVNGSVAGTSAYVNLSDERYKKDVQPIENALDKILSLNGVTFNWDKSKTDMNLDDANHIGFIAQEVEKIIPQAVSTATDENQTKSVAYTDIVPVSVEAIKEIYKIQTQQAELINILQAQIEELKTKLG